MNTVKSGVSLAVAAAVIALSSASVSTPAIAKAATAKLVHCYGVNDCKGQSDCKSGNHDCKGMNDCKGQGFKALSKKACTAQHGSLTAPK
jgi:uncharacterized membrane protein